MKKRKTELDYLELLKCLKFKTETTPNFSLGQFLKDYGFESKSSSVFTKNKLVVNTGSSKFPSYEWTSIKPNIKMAEKVMSTITERNRRYNESYKKTKSIKVVKPIALIKKPVAKKITSKEAISKCNKSTSISLFWGLYKRTVINN